MKTILFTLCDGAYNYDGRLTVVGTFDQIRMLSIPGTARTSFALKFLIPETELAQKAEIRIEFRDVNNNPISESITKSIPIPDTQKGYIHLAMAGSIQLNVAEAGKHRMLCFIDNRQVEELEFAIILQ